MTPTIDPVFPSSPPAAPRRATAAFMLSHPAHCIALGFGAGLSRIAPGTVGTLWAWLAFLALQQWLSPLHMGLLIAASTVVGWWGQLAAFALFRFFDAAKPGPVGWADSLFKGFGWRGGWGILWDDFVAAFCTLLAIALWRFWW